MLHDEGGAEIHLTKAAEDWLVPHKSPFGIYFYADNVEELARRLEGRLLHPPKQQPSGMFEFSVSDSDETLSVSRMPAGDFGCGYSRRCAQLNC